MAKYVYAKDSDGELYRFDNDWYRKRFVLDRMSRCEEPITTITRSRFSGIKKNLEYEHPYWKEISRGVCVYRERWY